MELYPPTYGSPPYPFLLPPSYLYSPPQNYVRWNQTPEAHIYTADLPGVRKEEIRVEVEDGRYLVIRTELDGDDDDDDEEMEVEERRRRRRRRFMRKFRLPENGGRGEDIGAGHEGRSSDRQSAEEGCCGSGRAEGGGR
ncbi:uncharacterized protein A4U43_C07F37730 [Asparagus officinalis]|uniref:SHSP domain-containing protein n=1 Tax=Asparagus officinalis TaxID=4686 RepID=A0A5P1EL37_ASPOF|nr:15.4 kDa class V heat shock protein-like [Asparagus officinalis]ONK65499.1 uncharacterized protein A4U43_C07F37730 [Asparagus officinalis]